MQKRVYFQQNGKGRSHISGSGVAEQVQRKLEHRCFSRDDEDGQNAVRVKAIERESMA